MNEAEERFAERLAEDLDRVLGVGLAVGDLELTTDDGHAWARATLLVDGRIEMVEVEAPTVLELYQPLVQRAAEVRLGAAFWRMIGPA